MQVEKLSFAKIRSSHINLNDCQYFGAWEHLSTITLTGLFEECGAANLPVKTRN